MPGWCEKTAKYTKHRFWSPDLNLWGPTSTFCFSVKIDLLHASRTKPLLVHLHVFTCGSRAKRKMSRAKKKGCKLDYICLIIMWLAIVSPYGPIAYRVCLPVAPNCCPTSVRPRNKNAMFQLKPDKSTPELFLSPSKCTLFVLTCV